MSDGDRTFAAALHRALRSQAGNLAYSPASVRIALAMPAAGARGETATEMYDALALPGEAGHAALGKTLAGWAERRQAALRVASRLWVQEGHALRDAFTRLLDGTYRAPIGTVDFHHDAARAAINRWAAAATDQKIKALIARPISPDTKLVITSATTFKASWLWPFQPAATTPQPFFTGDGRSVEVPMMRETAHFSLARLDGAVMVELPYGDRQLVMDVVVPEAREVAAPQGLDRLEEAYGGGALASWVAALAPARVDLALPRFRTSSSLRLADTLRALGIVRAFEYPGADFSGIDGTKELFIGDVIHQAFVAVDEHGTEAGAATAVMAVAGAAMRPQPPVVVRVDHPFLFFIRDTGSQAVLFAGRLVDPTKT